MDQKQIDARLSKAESLFGEGKRSEAIELILSTTQQAADNNRSIEAAIDILVNFGAYEAALQICQLYLSTHTKNEIGWTVEKIESEAQAKQASTFELKGKLNRYGAGKETPLRITCQPDSLELQFKDQTVTAKYTELQEPYITYSYAENNNNTSNRYLMKGKHTDASFRLPDGRLVMISLTWPQDIYTNGSNLTSTLLKHIKFELRYTVPNDRLVGQTMTGALLTIILLPGVGKALNPDYGMIVGLVVGGVISITLIWLGLSKPMGHSDPVYVDKETFAKRYKLHM
jgi:hypothetical protein